MPIKRTYAECGDACMTARAVELIGDRWTYPVLRELMLAPKRFKELSAAICGVTPAVLTTRLREMEAAGLVERVVLARPRCTSSAAGRTGSRTGHPRAAVSRPTASCSRC